MFRILFLTFSLLIFSNLSQAQATSNQTFSIATSISNFAGDEANGFRVNYQFKHHLFSIDYDTIYDSSLKTTNWTSYRFIGASYGLISNIKNSNSQAYIRTGFGKYYDIQNSESNTSKLQLFTVVGFKHIILMSKHTTFGGYIEAGSIGKGFHYQNEFELGHGFLQKVGIYLEI